MWKTGLAIGVLLVLAQGSAFGDACADVMGDTCGGTGSSHSSHPGYNCSVSVGNEQTDEWEDVRTIDKVWDEGDINCSCLEAVATYSITRKRTNTNNVSISGSYAASVSATAGANLGGLTKAEATATATWTAGLGWGHEDTKEEELTASSGFKATRCTEWSYKKWYWTGTVNGTGDLTLHWTDNLTCEGPGGYTVGHYGYDVVFDAVTSYARGWDYYNGAYPNPPGGGFQNWDVRCTKCGTQTDCYKGKCCPPQTPCN